MNSPTLIAQRPRPRRLWRALRAIGFVILIVAALGAGWRWWTRREPMAEREIYRGVHYQCLQLPDTPESGGLAHIVRVDLSAPGIKIWLTPMDFPPSAAGWEYSTKRVGRTVRDERLAVGVNGTFFSERMPIPPLAGDPARSVQTIVVEHAMNHLFQPLNMCLLWFDDDLTPHIENHHPLRPGVIPRARWAIGGYTIVLWDGKPVPNSDVHVDARTMTGIDPDRRILWLAVFEKVSFRAGAGVLAGLGAREAINLDGGTSSAMALGDNAVGVRPGLVMGGWRPVADQFGIQAEPLENSGRK